MKKKDDLMARIISFCFVLWLCIGGGKTYAQTDIYITSKADLLAIATSSMENYAGKTIYLKADIDLTGENWTPIGTESYPFKGAFEGWGHKITGLSISSTSDYIGVFGYIDAGSVRDLGVEGTIISGGNYVGGICGYINHGEISSCYSNIAVSGIAWIGGICGWSNGVIRNCWHEGNFTGSKETGVYVGGLVGRGSGTLQRSYVTNTTIEIPAIGSPTTNSYFGLIAGYWDGDIKDFDCCIYNSESVSVTGFEGYDIKVGSMNGQDSPSFEEKENVKGATTSDMKEATFWGGILNAKEETDRNNIVWKITDGNYPELYSFLKNEPVTFNFTSSKQWLTIVPNGDYLVPDGMSAYKVTMVSGSTAEGGTATLVPVATLNEGCGALVFSDGETPITVNGGYTGILADYSGNLLKGSPTSPVLLGGSELDDTEDYILQNGAFCRAIGTTGRGKAYLHLEKGTWSVLSAKLRLLITEEETSATGIQSIGDSPYKKCVWQTLDGRKLNGRPIEKGVYIYNGIKVLNQ